ncbi:MAG: orotidine-5'-phosphate decarboxylase [bacterium]|jgi:orotidine-5'-phosphate decarboxylase
MDMQERLIVALDFPSEQEALVLVAKLMPRVNFFKVGLELYTAQGRPMVGKLKDLGARVFLDLKLHDIPNTVAGAVSAATKLGVDMLTLHASGGKEMLRRAVAAAAETAVQAGVPKPLLLAVTVLTSTDQQVLQRELGVVCSLERQVVRLALLAQEAGVDGVVASPLEIEVLRRECGQDFKLVIPGVRPIGTAANDQRRVMPPKAAMEAGADYLVVGRPITRAADPLQAAQAIIAEMEEGV